MITLRPKHPEARRLLALAHCTLGERDKAIEIFEEWLEEEPDNPVARHMLAACSGRDVPARASDAYVEKTFDSFAASFEAKLAKLSYRAPALVAAMLEDSGLDAGEEPRRARRRLRHRPVRPAPRAVRAPADGVDLSAGHAGRRRRRSSVYDELVKAELTEYLRGHRRRST